MQNFLIIFDLLLFGCFLFMANYIAYLIIKNEAENKPIKRSLIILVLGSFNLMAVAIFLEFFKL